jgi:hypothetical protein
MELYAVGPSLLRINNIRGQKDEMNLVPSEPLLDPPSTTPYYPCSPTDRKMGSSDKKHKSKRRHRDRDADDDDEKAARGSLVNYSKVAEKQDVPSRGPSVAAGSSSSPQPGTAAAPKKVSAQMAAVMRLMAGQEERTIAQKLADSNRPTWEQYKKDNEDKLDISGLDQKKMEAYRKELDEQREKMLTRGLNHKDEKKKKSKKSSKRSRHSKYSDESDSYSDDSSDDSGRKRKRKKHKRKKSSRRYDSDSYDSEDDRKKSSKHKKKKDNKRRKKSGDDGSSSGDSYRLSSFFTKGSDDESK